MMARADLQAISDSTGLSLSLVNLLAGTIFVFVVLVVFIGVFRVEHPVPIALIVVLCSLGNVMFGLWPTFTVVIVAILAGVMVFQAIASPGGRSSA